MSENWQQPTSYQEMFHMAMREMKRQTDEYFDYKKAEFYKSTADQIEMITFLHERIVKIEMTLNCKSQEIDQTNVWVDSV